CAIVVDRRALAGQREVKSLGLRHCCLAIRSDVADLQAFATSPQDAIRKACATMVTAQQPCAGALDFVSRLGLFELRPLARKSSTRRRKASAGKTLKQCRHS